MDDEDLMVPPTDWKMTQCAVPLPAGIEVIDAVRCHVGVYDLEVVHSSYALIALTRAQRGMCATRTQIDQPPLPIEGAEMRCKIQTWVCW